MDKKVVPFPRLASARSPLAHFIRIGEAHKKIADLHASGRFPTEKAVFEASRLRHQKELAAILRAAGVEIVLDTEVAELAVPAKYGGHSRYAPWALRDQETPLGPEYFKPNAQSDVIGHIARFAVVHNVDTVLAPTHYLADPAFSNWLSVDRHSCLLLRKSLDREGGQNIAIDYPIITPHTSLNDEQFSGKMAELIADLPVDNIWVRASGLGSDSGPQTMNRYLSAMRAFHNFGKPIIADQLGGLPALIAMAFGAISGIAHGIGERERFDARTWHKPPPKRKDGNKFGRTVRIGIPGFGKSVTIKELELLATAKGGRKLVVCGERFCCQHGMKDTIADPRRHAAYQMFKQVRELEDIPPLNRGRYFLNGPMAEADRLARTIKRLKPSVEEARLRDIDLHKLMKRYHDHSRKLEQLRTTLERVHETIREDTPRARPIAPRQKRLRQIGEDEG